MVIGALNHAAKPKDDIMKSKLPRKRRAKKNILDRARWAGYAAAGAAAMFGVQEVADAKIHHFDIDDVFLDGRVTHDPYFVRFDANNDDRIETNEPAIVKLENLYIPTTTFGFRGSVAYASGMGGGLNGKIAAKTVDLGFGIYSYAYNLASQSPISDALNFVAGIGTMALGYGYTNSEFRNSGIGHLAFSFKVDANTETQYGWIRVSMTEDIGASPYNTYSVTEFAYGDPGELIKVGEVPEPGSLGLLATGALGLLLWRYKRRGRKDAT